jgi:hypothetical protein
MWWAREVLAPSISSKRRRASKRGGIHEKRSRRSQSLAALGDHALNELLARGNIVDEADDETGADDPTLNIS